MLLASTAIDVLAVGGIAGAGGLTAPISIGLIAATVGRAAVVLVVADAVTTAPARVGPHPTRTGTRPTRRPAVATAPALTGARPDVGAGGAGPGSRRDARAVLGGVLGGHSTRESD